MAGNLSDLAAALAAAPGPSRDLDERMAVEKRYRQQLRDGHAAAEQAAKGRGYKLHPRIAVKRLAAARLAMAEQGDGRWP